MTIEACAVLRNLRHSYGNGAEVLRGVDLEVPQGEILALLGLNGSGKTTLLRLLLGLLRPTSGRLEVLGHELGKDAPPADLLARIGYVPEHPFPAERATPRALLAFVRSVHPRWQDDIVQRYLSIFHIPLDKPCKELSAGTKSQLALTLAMAGQPDLVVLDEPTTGLDPLHRRQYLQVLLEEATQRRVTILLTTHDLYQIERMADSVALLHQGVIVQQAPLDDLKNRVKRVRVGADTAPALEEKLLKLPDVLSVRVDPGGYLVATTRISEELRDSVESLPEVHGVEVVDLSLEEIFLVYCEDGVRRSQLEP